MTCSNREKHLYGISNGSIHEWTEVSEVLAQPTTSNNQTDWNVNLVIQLWDISWSQWPRRLRRRSAAVRLLRLSSNPTEGMDICLLWVLCFVRERSLRRAHHSSTGVLPIVVRRWVWSKNLVNEEASAHWGLWPPKQTNNDGTLNLINQFETAIGLFYTQISWMNNRRLKKKLDIWRFVKAIQSLL
jgi:hypothetical protein